MSVSFPTLPGNLRVPLFYAEMDNSAANQFSQNQRTLLIGHKLAVGSGLSGVPLLITNLGLAWSLFGRGSMLAAMAETVLLNDPMGELWAIAVDEPVGAAAAGTVTLTGPASAAGTLTLYVAGQRVQAAVAAGDTPTAMATSLAAVLNATLDLPMTASSAAGVVTLTARWKGAGGNDIRVVPNYRGALGGEALPAGVGLTVVAPSGGSGAPALATAITAMGDDEYDFIACGFNDSTSLDALKTELGDTSGRWAWSRQVYGHVYAALRGTVATLIAFGQTRNDQHASVAAFETEVPHPAWQYTAAYAARNALFLKADPARPTQTGELVGILPAPKGKTFVLSERQTLLNYGLATSYTAAGAVRVERAITTYQKNAWGQPDVSYLDSETLHLSATVLRRLRQLITSKYGRHKVADDGTKYGPGQAIVTPATIRAELVAEYGRMEYEGLVENAELFKQNLIVERDPNNASRINVLFPPDYVNGLRVFAVLNQFRLQY